ncbi:MAG: pyridoxamine 5'-phosphate oxidase family protein [Nitrososphaerales archaeon]
MDVPEWIEDIFYNYQRCRFTYDGGSRPIAIPVGPLYDADRSSLAVHTSISFYHKVKCVKRNPKVAILYSMFGGQIEKPVVLVQGEAVVHEEDLEKNSKYITDLLGRQRIKESLVGRVLTKQRQQMSSTFGKIMMDWYLKRIIIEVTPHKILAWHNGDLDEQPEIFEVK